MTGQSVCGQTVRLWANLSGTRKWYVNVRNIIIVYERVVNMRIGLELEEFISFTHLAMILLSNFICLHINANPYFLRQ